MKTRNSTELGVKLFPSFSHLSREDRINLTLILHGLGKHLTLKQINPRTKEVTLVVKLPGFQKLKTQLEQAGYKVNLENGIT